MKRDILVRLLATVALVVTGGCGGEGQQAPPPASQGVMPGPTSTPTPSPTPASVQTIAGVSPGGRLATDFVCAGIPQVTRVDSRITAVGNFGPAPESAGYQSLEYQAANTFAFDNNGFGGSTFLPADKRSAVSPTHDLYVHVYTGPSPSELQMWTAAGAAGLEFGTVGLLAEDYDGGSLCFFAAGKELSLKPDSNGFDYIGGRADGLSQIGGVSRRLHGSTVGLNVDFAARKGTVTLNLVGRENPFSDLSGPSSSLGTLTGEVTISGGAISGTVSGENGTTGSVRGHFYNQLALGVGLVFELKDSAGRTAIGAAAADLRQI